MSHPLYAIPVPSTTRVEATLAMEPDPVQIMNKPWCWDNGSTITVKFIQAASANVMKKVEDNAHIWETYANIKFQFVTSGNAQIRIAFNTKGGQSLRSISPRT